MTISATLVHSPASAGATNVANPIPRPLETEAQRSDAQLAQWFSFLSGHTLQTKLQVSSPGDADEREADAAADLVMQGGSPAISISSVPPTLNRKCSACKDDEQKLQRKATDRTAAERTAPPIAESILHSAGRRLDAETQDFMAGRFGTDFSDVRVHTDGQAARSAAAVNAKAYAVGRDIVFGAGQFDPRSDQGRHLLAHELAHVVQQRGSSAVIQREVDDDESGAEGGSDDEPIAFVEDVEEVEEAEELALEDAETATADDALEVDSGDLFAAAGGSKQKNKKKNTAKNKKKASKSGGCAGDCPQGKQPKIINNDCAESRAVDKTNFITNLDVKIGAGEVTATWSNKKTDTWPCTANPTATPKTTDEVVGVKCTKDHTNAKKSKDGMAWFTGFRSQGKRIGFHDSQPVGPGFKSHGCVRVCCDKAELINKNTSSGVTKITVAK